MHPRGIVPNEEWLPVPFGLVHEVARRLYQRFTEAGHVVLCLQERQVVHVGYVRHVSEGRQRTFIYDLLLSDFAPTRHFGLIIGVGRIAVDQIARTVLVEVLLRPPLEHRAMLLGSSARTTPGSLPLR